MPARRRSIVRTSARSGTPSRATGASARSAAAISGSAAFLAPLAGTVPSSLTGPLRRNASTAEESSGSPSRPDRRRGARDARRVEADALEAEEGCGLDEGRDVVRLAVPELEDERGARLQEAG